MIRPLAFLVLALGALAAPAAAETLRVTPREVTDLKAVFATVQSRDVTVARSRINGTVESLSIDEGSRVEAGTRLARVVDPKLELEIAAVNAQIDSARSQRQLARTTLERMRKLRSGGTVSEARLDEARTNLEVAEKKIASLRAQRAVTERRMAEGDILAPTDGRVLDVQVTEGTVIMPGEVIARLASQGYFLRLKVPERHAASINVGDLVRVGPRGVEAAPRIPGPNGTVTQVYPDMQQGRVVADVEVEADLTQYLVGERIRTWVEAGTRQAFVVPEDYLFRRYGVTYVRLEGGTDVVVQPGRPADDGREILAGLRAGDVLVKPE